MYLKRLEIQGFKSFADKIEMQFEGGITGVVGPNGSGKSNISDSIRWVLGEQSPKSLRGSKMEDVIFAGTTSRKPVGMAEVSITLDNTSNVMPIDYGEVTITRRVYRSGESEYYLNKSSCRLKDIRELLMDTGIGREGYSIIGQGKIDEILSSKPEERRLIFEEAAGIIKYKTRRDEAEKKLNTTKDNLLRVADILHELENQLEPLRRQSIKAKKYQEIKAKLLNLEVNLFIRDIDKAEGELKNVNQQVEIINSSIMEHKCKKEQLQMQIEAIKKELFDWEQEYTQLQNTFFSTENEIKEREGEIQLYKEKLQHNNENVDRIKEEIISLEMNEKDIVGQLDKKVVELEEICNKLQKMESSLEEKRGFHQKQLEDNARREKQLEDTKTNIIENLNNISDKKSELNSLKTLLTTIEERLNQIINDNSENVRELEVKEKEIQSLVEEDQLLKRKLVSLSNEEAQAKETLTVLDDKLMIEHKGLEANKNQLNHFKSRKNILEDMEKEHEGFSKSVKNILQACDENPQLGKGVHGVVANLLEVPKGYEVAIETALGPAIQNIVSDDEEDAKRLIEYLKKYNLGRITILPINAIKGRGATTEEEKVIKGLKDVKIAFEIIKTQEAYKDIFASLLGRTLIAADLNAGIQAAKKLSYRFKIVTIDGDVINTGGALTGGSSIKNTTGILGRKRELEDLYEKIKNMESKEKNLQSNIQQLLMKKNLTDEGLLKLNSEKQELRINEATIINKIQQANKEKQQMEADKRQISDEIQQLNQVKEDTLIKIHKKNNEIICMENEIADTKNTATNMNHIFQEEKVKLEALYNEITSERIKVASIEGQKNTKVQEIEHLQQSISRIKKSQDQKRKEILDINHRFISLNSQLKDGEVLLDSLMKKAGEVEKQIKEQKDRKNSILAKEMVISQEFNTHQEEAIQLQESLHKLELKKTRYDMQLQSIYNKLWEEYQLTYNTAVEMKTEVEDIPKANRDIKAYREEIKLLGNINLESIEEYERIRERYDFLRKQQEDLNQAQDSLKDIIMEMEKTMEKQFNNQFQIIRENFNSVFVKLFGGGRADLVIEDEGNVLKSGVDIIAQPPGKKLQNLSLLSGGERALTAISLLFAILLVKPSPFCILDEIEAALDDANVHRFSAFLKELSQTTQFIIVTHRKGTMEISDVLYGVTMEEEGVSKLVSVKLTDHEEDDIAS